MEKLPNSFFTSINLSNHPLCSMKDNIRYGYYHTLKDIALSINNNDSTIQNVGIYSKKLNINNNDYANNTKAFLKSLFKPWRKKYIIILCYDLLLISSPHISDLADFSNKLFNHLSQYYSKRQLNSFMSYFNKISLSFKSKLPINTKYGVELFSQILNNFDYLNKKQINVIFTANMSSGKSTVINAITGKSLAQTSQEACTGNICYIIQNSFNDGRIHISKPNVCFCDYSSYNKKNNWESSVTYSTSFNMIHKSENIFCCIDTPGVNSVMNPTHRKITLETLQNENYDILVYILCANSLGTDEEINHLKWIKNNANSSKIIFALNKLDTFRAKEDDIKSSIDAVYNDLLKIGFENPIVCPISAYFAYLIKKRNLGIELDEDESDEIELLEKKFSKPQYDLSVYYPSNRIIETDDNYTVMLKKCGFYGFEKLLTGGCL